MRRPRHRVKSNLIWKMLAVAIVVNLMVWPILARLGARARIREARLIAVRLVSLPPPAKPADALGPMPQVSMVSQPPRVVRAAIISRPSVVKPPRTVTHPIPAARSVPRVTPTPDALTAERALLASLPQHPTAITPPRPTQPTSLPAPQHNPETQAASEKAAEEASAARLLLAARRARADRLEALGHQVALQIASTRVRNADANAATSTPSASESGSAGNWDSAPHVTETQTPDDPAPITAPALFQPAVALSQPQPEIPASLQNSAWHATFRGEFVIHKDGTTTVRMLTSTGHPVLDRRALEAARRWKFRPATLNGAPTTSSLKFEIAYNVRAAP